MNEVKEVLHLSKLAIKSVKAKHAAEIDRLQEMMKLERQAASEIMTAAAKKAENDLWKMREQRDAQIELVNDFKNQIVELHEGRTELLAEIDEHKAQFDHLAKKHDDLQQAWGEQSHEIAELKEVANTEAKDSQIVAMLLPVVKQAEHIDAVMWNSDTMPTEEEKSRMYHNYTSLVHNAMVELKARGLIE